MRMTFLGALNYWASFGHARLDEAGAEILSEAIKSLPQNRRKNAVDLAGVGLDATMPRCLRSAVPKCQRLAGSHRKEISSF